MRHTPLDNALFVENRRRLRAQLLPNSLVALNANDTPLTNADGTLPLVANSDLFYLTGIEQEETVLLLAPDAHDEDLREVLFLREATSQLKLWEGNKLQKDEATAISGIKHVAWLPELPGILHRLMCEAEHVFLNSNEHSRASIDVETRDARFIRECQMRYPLHQYHRLARIMHRLRMQKSAPEIALLQRAIQVTEQGLRRVFSFVRPGVAEYEVEAELAHEFTRNRCRFAFEPIVAAGARSCILHYRTNDQVCQNGELLLLDVGAAYANYNADVTRTIPVNGRFTPRQRQVYEAVLRVLRRGIELATVGKLHRDWQHEIQIVMNDELVHLGLISQEDARRHTKNEPACKKFFMHGLGHPLGLDVHDVGYLSEPFCEGMVLTVEPGIYIPEENIAIRLENDILLTAHGSVDLTAEIPIEPDEIERLVGK